MTVTLVKETYVVEMNAAERELLLAAVETAIGAKRCEPELVILLASLDVDALDGLADRLFLVSREPIATA